MNALEQLKQQSIVVADTGDVDAIKQYQPEDATTNPSLLLKAAQLPVYRPLLAKSIAWAKQQSDNESIQIIDASDMLAVLIGAEISKIVPGRISTEVDARLSFDEEASFQKARKLVDLYESEGIGKDKILIKLAATWQGIKAAERLEKLGINCNLTLIFSFAQARACAEAGVFLISPFVGRILDWYKAKQGVDSIAIEQDPGVASVSSIYRYFKKYEYKTIVMGASFRSVEQVLALAGCDRLTISPNLLAELGAGEIEQSSLIEQADLIETNNEPLTISEFLWQLNEDAMATEKLAEGIRQFAVDQNKLEQLLRQTW